MNSIKSTVITAIVVFIASQVSAISLEKISFDIGMGYGGFNNILKIPHNVSVPQPELPPIYYSYDDVIDKGYKFHSEALYQVSNNLALGAGIRYIFAGVNFQDVYYRTFQDDYDNRKPRSEFMEGLHENINFIMPYIIAKYEFKLLSIELFSKLSLGYYYSRTNYISSQISTDAGYTLNTEILHRVKKKLSLGFNASVLYGYRNENNLIPAFDAERYELTGEPGSDLYDSDVYFYFPSIFAKYKFKIIFFDSFIKAGIGYGLELFKLSDSQGNYQSNASGIGLYTSLGNSIRINNNSSVNIEIGYRYLKTGDLKYQDEQNYFYHRYFGDSPLDFSGPFVQSSFSFNL